jgi:hypothetical protein
MPKSGCVQSHKAIVLSVIYITSSKRDFQKARTIILKTVVSLFSGCGGFDLGFKEEGFDLIYASDSDPAAVDYYSRNVDPRVFIRDVTSEARFFVGIKQSAYKKFSWPAPTHSLRRLFANAAAQFTCSKRR